LLVGEDEDRLRTPDIEGRGPISARQDPPDVTTGGLSDGCGIWTGGARVVGLTARVLAPGTVVAVCGVVARGRVAGAAARGGSVWERVEGAPALGRDVGVVVFGVITRDGRVSPLAADLPGWASATAADRQPADIRAPAAIHLVPLDTERKPASRSNSFLTSFKYEGPRPKRS
jgi:hypothetical protein